jgi:hypothetical protein
MSTTFFIQNETEINTLTNQLILPSIFQTNYHDFGNNDYELVLYIRKYLSPTQLLALNELSNYSILFKKYDWSVNTKSLKEECVDVDIDFDKIRTDPVYRDYFYQYCKSEFSTENIDLWVDISFFERINKFNVKKKYQYGFFYFLKILAKYLFHTYMEINSIKQININAQLVHYYRDILENDEHKILDENFFNLVKKELEFIMVDTFSRFKFSSLYNEMLEEYVINDLKSFFFK